MSLGVAKLYVAIWGVVMQLLRHVEDARVVGIAIEKFSLL